MNLRSIVHFTLTEDLQYISVQDTSVSSLFCFSPTYAHVFKYQVYQTMLLKFISLFYTWQYHVIVPPSPHVE